MSTKITLKKSSVPGKIPTTNDLALGELAVNTYDGKLYLKKNVTGTESVVEVGKVTPGGNSGELQYNNNGALGAVSGLSWDSANVSLNFNGGTITSNVSPLFNISQTWNSSANVFTAVRVNVTDTASAAGSLLMDLQVGGASRFSVRKTGKILATNLSTTDPGLAFLSRPTTGLAIDDTITSPDAYLHQVVGGVIVTAARSSVGFQVVNGNLSLGPIIGVPDIILTRDAADTLAQRRGTNAQTFRLYNTFTDASNYERLNIGYTSGTGSFTISTSAAGTGTIRALDLAADGLNNVRLKTNNTVRWLCNFDGHFLAQADNTYDIGASSAAPGAARPRFLYLGGGSLTGSAADSSLTISPTWNTSGAPTAIKLNVTDTASASGSLLMDLQVGGASRFQVTKTGRAAAGFGYTYGSPQFYDHTLSTTTGFAVTSNDECVIYGNGTALFGVSNTTSNGIRINSLTSIGWVSGHAISNAADLRLFRDAANTLAQRNGTNAQTFRLYNTYTDSSNYERVSTFVSSNVFYIESQAAGTGTRRPLRLSAGDSPGGDGGYLNISPAGAFDFARSGTATWWQITSSGHFLAGTDNTYDIGASFATRPRNVYVAGFVNAHDEFRLANTYTRVADADSGGGFAGGYNLFVDGAIVKYDSLGSIAGFHYRNQGVISFFTGGTAAAGTTATERMRLDSSGNLGIGTTSPSATLDVVGTVEINSNVTLSSEATTLATTTKTQVASFTTASFRSGKLVVQAYDSVTGEVQISELLVAHNGTTASATEYGVVCTGNVLATYDVDINSGNVRLLATRTSSNSTQYKISETLIAA